MKTFVTGGTGFIGQHLLKRLLQEGCDVHCLSRQARPSGQITYHQGDLSNPAGLPNTHTLYHLAVTTTPGNANQQPIFDAQTNLIGTLHLLQAAVTAGVRRIIFVSSGGSVYGVTKPTPIPETHPTNPISAHGVTKLAIEKYLAIFKHQFGLDYRVLRAGNPYGNGQVPGRGQGFIPHALHQITHNQPITIWGDGSVVRDFFHVQDLIQALWQVTHDTHSHTTYNVASGTGHSLRQIITLLQQATHKTAHVTYTPGRTADVPHNILDTNRIRTTLNWQPQISLPQGIQLISD